MEVLHITPTKNINSIRLSRINRSTPILPIYNTIMKDYYGEMYNKDKGLVFAFPENHNRRDKFIKDFVYWKMWGEPRNIILDKFNSNDYEENKNVGFKIFSKLKIIDCDFSILLLNIEYEEIFDYYLHQQDYQMSEYWLDMDMRYEHNDKPLVLVNYDIPVKNILGILGTASGIVKRKNKIDVSLNIGKLKCL